MSGRSGRILVTGGAGFIGSHLVAALLERGEAVTVLDDFSSGHERNLEGLSGDLEVVRGDVAEERDVQRALKNVRAVLHEAALVSVVQSVEEPLHCERSNSWGTLLLLEAARRAGVRKLVLAASAAAYGERPQMPCREEAPVDPRSPYAATKLAAEHHLRCYAALHGMHTLSLRYFNVYGPRQDPASPYAAVVPRFVERLLAGTPPVLYGDGGQSRDFVFVGDVVRANLLALESDALRGQVVNVASGRETTVLELLDALYAIVGRRIEPRREPPRPGDVRRSWAATEAAERLLGFRARVGLEEGLRQVVEWARCAA